MSSQISKQELADITTNIIRKGLEYNEDVDDNRHYYLLFWPTRKDAERQDVYDWFMDRGIEALKPPQIILVRESYRNMRYMPRTPLQDLDYKAGEKLWYKIKSSVLDLMNKIYGMDTLSIPILTPATGIIFKIFNITF